jgi:hypothetical protein
MSPTPAASSPEPQETGRSRTRSRERWAVRAGLGISIVLHGLALVLYPVLMDRVVPPTAPAAPTPPDPTVRGIEIVALRELAPEDEPEPPPEEPVVEDPTLPTPVRPLPPLDPGVAPEPGDVAAEDEEERRRATVAERLQPSMGDPRLWAPLDREYTELSDEERAELLLRGMIRSWNDSVAVAAALSGQATDWTYTDEDGRRWGLSPGRLHLGDFSIPLPFSFEVPPGRREAMARRQWEVNDLIRGAAAAEVRETWSERAREIRERMDRERGGGG